MLVRFAGGVRARRAGRVENDDRLAPVSFAAAAVTVRGEATAVTEQGVETGHGSPREGERRRGRPRGLSDRVRRDVYRAVRSLLVTVGYGALRLDEVAAAAGVNKSTLYRQWSSKAQLVRDVLVAGEVAHFPRPDEGSWEADLTRLCDELCRLFNNPVTIAMVRTRAMADDPELTRGLREAAAREMTFVREPFERAIARGEIAPDADVEMLVECLISPLLARVAVTGQPIDSAFMDRLRRLIHAAATTPTTPNP